MAGGSPVNDIAEWNDTSWSALGTGMNTDVYALAVYNSSLFATGKFTVAGGNPANYIAEWNGVSWSALNSGLNNIGWELCTYSGNLYSGGQFTNAGGKSSRHIAEWSAPTSVNEIEKSSGVNLFPDPGNGYFQLQINTNQVEMKYTVEVYNILGEKVYSKEFPTLVVQPGQAFNSPLSIDLTDESSGIYFYKVFSEPMSLLSEGKLIIQR